MICWSSFWLLCRGSGCLALPGVGLGLGLGLLHQYPLFVCPTGVLGYDYGSWVAAWCLGYRLLPR